ncbi:MAG: DsbA family protein [Anaerolineae bacterium]|nr:DsbA family protein [Anaerolineae bacterium]
MKELEQQYDLDIHWRSYELRPAGSPPIPPAYMAQIEQGRVIFKQRAQADYGVTINSGPFGFNSRPALILEKYAQAHGQGRAYHHWVERAYWLEARDISRLDVLAEALKAVGLETHDLDTIFADPVYEQQVDQDIALAYQIGIQGVPAAIFAERYLVPGAQPVDVFKQVIERVLANRTEDRPC